MPYISKNDSRREALRKGEPALNAGELNYQIFYYIKHGSTCLRNSHLTEVMKNQIKSYVDQFLGEKPNYQRYNEDMIMNKIESQTKYDEGRKKLLEIKELGKEIYHKTNGVL